MTRMLRDTRLAVVDVEGNGAQPPEIVELAVLPIDHGQPRELCSWLVRPSTPITAIVTRKVHGISNNDVADCPAWPAVAETVSANLSGRILVAHNASVERSVLATHLPGWEPPAVIDTLRLARHVWPDLGRHSLDALAEHARIDMTSIPGKRHRAGYDAQLTWQLLKLLIDSAAQPWHDILSVAAMPSPPAQEEGLW